MKLIPVVAPQRLRILLMLTLLEAVSRRCSMNKVFLKILQNPEESACVGLSV